MQSYSFWPRSMFSRGGAYVVCF